LNPAIKEKTFRDRRENPAKGEREIHKLKCISLRSQAYARRKKFRGYRTFTGNPEQIGGETAGLGEELENAMSFV